MSYFASSLTWRRLVHARRDVTLDFASSLTWFGDVGPCTESCDVGFCFVFDMVQYRRRGWREESEYGSYGPASNIHARRDAMSGFLFVLTLVYFEECYGAVCRNPCTEKCDVGFLLVFIWVVDRKTQTLRPHALQSSCLESKGGDVDLLPDVTTC